MTVDKYPDFVGRQSQINQLIQAAKAGDGCNHVLLLDGQGGIGKTALLQEIEKRLKKDAQVLCTRLIDMDDTSFHLSSYFSRTIADDLGREAFANYLNALDFYEAEERRHLDLKTMYAHLQKCGYAFTENFNRLARSKRLTILIDTFEEVQDTDLWSFFKQMFVELNNATFIIAGRRVSELHSKINNLQQKFGNGRVKAEMVPLAGLAGEEIDAFFAEIARLDKDQKRILALLTDGNPLLLCLALDCYRYGYWLEALDQTPLAELEKFISEDSAAAKRLQYEFEKSLVVAYADAEPFCYSIRQLAHASRRIDQTIFKTLIAFRSEEETELWWRELQKLPYIRKRASSDYISVHDVLRELIFTYVMPRRDPDRQERKQINQKIIVCYKTLLTQSRQSLKTYEDDFAEKARQQDKLVERSQPIAIINLADLITQSNALERTIWILQAEALHYQLIVDLDEGSQSFIRQFDDATRDRHLTLRQRLTHEIKPFLADGTIRAGTPIYLEISRRLTALEAETGQAEEAVKRVELLLRLYPNPDLQVELIELRAACKLNLEKNGIEQAIADYELALRQALALQLPVVACARLEKQLGWCYRQIGNWEQASSWYAQAQRRLMDSQLSGSDKAKELASLYTNFAYVEALQGNFARALDLGQRGLQTRIAFGLKREQGMSYSTIGEIYRYNRNFAEALTSYRKAEDIFNELDDREWLGRLWQQEAICLLQMGGDLHRALEKIKQAIDYCTRYNQRALPSAYNRAGRIIAALKEGSTEERLNQSLYYFRIGIERSLDAGDMWFFCENCVEAIEMLKCEYESSRQPKWLKDLKEFDDQIIQKLGNTPSATQQKDFIYFPDLYGRRELVLATLDYLDGFPDQTTKLDSALQHYVQGFRLVTQSFFGSYGLLHTAKELDDLARRVIALPSPTNRRWRNKFAEEWNNEMVHPTLRSFPDRLDEQLNVGLLAPELESIHKAD